MTSSWRATSSYFVVTLVMTWPLVIGLTRDVPADLGDSLLNMWILAWGAEHAPRVLTGQIPVTEVWNANIFHPEPLALSFSEHLFGQVLQILPVYHLTGNVILCYNLLFLSTFVLSGLGMYLLVRDLTGNPWAAFVAGLVFAFIPYRIAQAPHIQSLSAQWMPLALYGFRRFIVTNRVKALAGGSAALLMQNWSCGYYLIFFSPFVALFVVHQIVAAGRWRDWRVWGGFAAAASIVAAGTWPFLTLYLEAQRIHGFERPLGEVIRFSADVYSYLTAPEAVRLWGSVVQAYPKPEGELFFGVVPVLLAIIAIVSGWPGEPIETRGVSVSPARRIAAIVLLAIVLIQLAGFIGIVFTGGFISSVAGMTIRATNPSRVLAGAAIAFATLLVMSPVARARTRTAARSPLALSIVLMLLAMWLSLGPIPQSRGRALPGLGLYGVLYEHVPGFEGLRVPARYAMVAAVFLSIAAGYGAARVLARSRRIVLAATLLSVVFLAEAAFVPLPVNLTWGDGAIIPAARVEPAATAPAVYRQLAAMPAARVLAEFPFGDPAWDLRYVYYSTVHWKRLVNGYSGGFPHAYKVRVALLQRLAENPDAAWQAVLDAGTTHVVVHRDGYPGGDASVVEQWLLAHGAAEIARVGNDHLYATSPER